MKSLPNDVELEKKVLGAMLFDRDAVPGVRDILSPSDFYYERHTKLYKAILAVFKRGDPVDSEILLQELRKRKHLEEIGGALYLADLATEVATAANVEYHAKIVVDYSQRRKTIVEAQKLEQAAYDLNQPMPTVLEGSESTLRQIASLQKRERKRFKHVMTLGELLDSEDEPTNPLLQREGDNPILDLNQVLTLAGNTGVGKTVISIQAGMTLACGQKLFGIWGPEEPVKVVHVHCEMEKKEYTKQQVRKMLPMVQRLWGHSAMELCRENYTLIGGTELMDDTQVDLYNMEHQKVLVDEILQHGAKLLILDPMYWLVSESDENLAKDMAKLNKAVRTVTGLADCAIVETTHYNKAGELPGSYVKAAGVSAILKLRELEGYEQYGRDDIGLYLFKARNGWPMDGKTGWYLRLNRDKLWFEVDESVMLPSESELKSILRKLGEGPGRQRVYDVSVVREILKIHGDLPYADLAANVVEDLACSEATAKRLISDAKKTGQVWKNGTLYSIDNVTFPFGD